MQMKLYLWMKVGLFSRTHEELMEFKGMYYTLYKSQIEQDKELQMKN